MHLVIMRGISGSGKSTLARGFSGAYVLSTDDYFMANQNGTTPFGAGDKYLFDPKQIPAAHAWNQARCDRLMQGKAPLIVIDNTTTQAWEAREYCRLAQAHGYTVEFVEAECRDPVVCHARNAHGVPLSAVQAMASRYESGLTVEKCLAAKAP